MHGVEVPAMEVIDGFPGGVRVSKKELYAGLKDVLHFRAPVADLDNMRFSFKLVEDPRHPGTYYAKHLRPSGRYAFQIAAELKYQHRIRRRMRGRR